jgi:hypothetical protein
MEDGTLDALEILLSMAIKIPAGSWLLRWDERRLARSRPDLYERTWPASTRLCAVVVFQEIGIWIYFWRTRRWGAGGFGLGIIWAVAYLIATSIPLVAIDALLRDG